MEFKKCERCGCFFVSDNAICCNCEPKDTLEILTLKNYLEVNNEENTVENLSINTGISEKNLNRYLNMDGFKNT